MTLAHGSLEHLQCLCFLVWGLRTTVYTHLCRFLLFFEDFCFQIRAPFHKPVVRPITDSTKASERNDCKILIPVECVCVYYIPVYCQHSKHSCPPLLVYFHPRHLSFRQGVIREDAFEGSPSLTSPSMVPINCYSACASFTCIMGQNWEETLSFCFVCFLICH